MEISPGCSLERMMLKLKLQYFSHLMWRVDSLGKTDAGRDWGQETKGTTEDEMAGWHHWVHGHESEWIPGVGEGQGGLACCNSWGRKELAMTERLNWTEDGWVIVESSDKMWSTGERNGKLLQYSSLENPMNSIKKKSTEQVKREVNFDKENLIGLSGRNTLLKWMVLKLIKLYTDTEYYY